MNVQCESLAADMETVANEVLAIAKYPHETLWAEGVRIAAALTRQADDLEQARAAVYTQWQRTMPVRSDMRAGLRAGLTMLDKECREESKP